MKTTGLPASSYLSYTLERGVALIRYIRSSAIYLARILETYKSSCAVIICLSTQKSHNVKVRTKPEYNM